MRDLPVRLLLDRLASADPTPGGGSASALAGAMAAALVAMVARLSRGKGGDDAALDRVLAQAERGREALTDLADLDAQAFDGVVRAMRLPRGTDQEKRARQAAVQQALREATEVPLRVARESLQILRAAPPLARHGNPNAGSDVAVAALLGYAALHGALHNVRINLVSIKDEAYAAATTSEGERLGREAAELRDGVMAALRERM